MSDTGRGSYVRLLGYLKPFLGLFALSTFLTLVMTGLDLFSLVLVIPLLQNLFGEGTALTGPQSTIVERTLDFLVGGFIDTSSPLESLRNVCLLVLGAIVLKNAALVGSRATAIAVREGVERDMREDVYGHLQLLPLSYFGQTKAGQLLTRVLTDTRVARDAITYGLADVIRKVLTAAVYTVVLFLVSWRLSIVALLFAPMLAIVLAPLLKRLRKGFRAALDKQGELLSVLQENVSGIRLVKSFGAEAHEKARFALVSELYRRRQVRTSVLADLASPLSETLSSVVALGLVWIGAWMVLGEGSLTAEQFLFFVTVALQLISPLKAIADYPAKLQLSVAAADRFFEVLDAPVELAGGDSIARPPELGVRFEAVSFEYEPDRPVLRDVSFEIEAGEVLAIVGPSGAGKTTLVDLLPRFIDPTSGYIAIDGTDIRDFTLASLRELFGVVSQETVIFHDTVRANIAYGRPDRWSDDEILSAAVAAHAADFVSELPDGLDTVLGDRGVRLSGGQRQRIGLARAILRDPPILILDEATSALDSESEQLIQRALDRLLRDRTVFVIAHRLSTVRGADRILVLDDGAVVGSGSHQELLEDGGIYRRLHELQFTS
ncbi:MAG: ABC transporter ATP-binding protein/permease [marine benthic group bacterium]|jgi:subfamily B ATP-binding cassette protein MsbA|nr:ABC transporter ATP-binding protein/permease [Candidatus Carthagonibacter metallireducens]MCL7968354.1 ABC transporter ATP-binding protein/permease [Gemmatimonadota bacterium]MCL7979915.1 ABC transporter ATP-binding protein/permease [Gemmatimonadota bacterium]